MKKLVALMIMVVLILSAKVRLFLLKKAEEKGGKFYESW